ncbi:MAG: polymer-forming cytoskeletal protein [Chitinivibrionales bacterium]|nr:polymer-forming cytoskeletal protein [Chitinivibrionales bacterium]
MEKGQNKGLYTILGEGSVIEGSLTVPHNVRIDGTFKGKIETSEILTVGTAGVVQADIKAKCAVIGGKIEGNLMVEEKVELESQSVLIGDLKSKNLIINEGAVFHGTSSMNYDKTNKI